MQAEPASPPTVWSESRRLIPRLVVRPLLRFMELEASSAAVMLGAAVLAVVWANSAFADGYTAVFDTAVRLSFGTWHPLGALTVREWVNDGAMTLFFFVVALEIKRELVHGELRRPAAAALPVLAAVGGMVVPAVIYLSFTAGTAGASGWGVPMATDIAFAVAVVTAAGSRVPPAARVFLLTLAIADDLGAIVVIALFYAGHLAVLPLLGALATVGVAWLLQRGHVRALTPYVLLGIGCWVLLHHSGVHPTLAGVAFGLLTPAWPWYDATQFAQRARAQARAVEDATSAATCADPTAARALTADQLDSVRSAVRETVRLAHEALPPLDRIQARLSALVSFVVVPVFALANAGFSLSGRGSMSHDAALVTAGVGVGLVAGKTLGIFGTTWVVTRLPGLTLPSGTRWTHLLGLSLCAGIGFTVALFVGDIAFSDAGLGEAAKLGIFTGSVVSGLAGFIALRCCRPR
ncbi:hypothetical protein ASD06_15170 [Angustibacter sp. Root456]|nr:hypothetical protein ASD06_15170 [Angustibacter sp. Root456]